MTNFPSPFAEYLNGRADLLSVPLTGGSARVVEHAGRLSLTMSSRHARIAIDRHNLNADAGSLTFWLLSFEDLGSSLSPVTVDESDPDHWAYTLISDIPEVRKRWEANFALVWDHGWYPQFYVKFYRGMIYPPPRKGLAGACGPGQAGYEQYRAMAGAGHWSIRKFEWYQVGLCWDKPRQDYRLYLNGIAVASAKRGIVMQHDPCGPTLFMGNACFVFSQLGFYAAAFDHGQMARLFAEQGGNSAAPLNRELAQIYRGTGNPRWTPPAPDGWSERVALTLQAEADLRRFYIQGCLTAPSISPEGLRLKTPMRRPRAPGAPWYEDDTAVEIPADRLAPPGTWRAGEPRDLEQVYLWLREPWLEGDLRVEYEFKPLQDDGLSLLMVQATGMQREDFMADDPPRTNGSMRTVFGENVRNYHWEYFRRVADTRTDLASHVLVKNPCRHPLAMGHQPILQIGRWHRLAFIQEGARLRGAVDDEVVFDCIDEAFANHGPVYNCGRIAIRCMIQSDVLFRNLRIWNRPLPYCEVARRTADRGA